jgi:hypothetical protein
MKYFILFFASLSLTASATTPAPDCLEGFYDLGRRAAAIGFESAQEKNRGYLVFCHRAALLEHGICTGEAHKIPCVWLGSVKKWHCSENGYYANLEKETKTAILFEFKSNFSEGSLWGVLIRRP